MSIQVIAVDERTNCQERHDPCFRVYLHESGGDTTFGAVATYDITGADVLQVIDWAQTQAEGWSRATGAPAPPTRSRMSLKVLPLPTSTAAPWSGCLGWTATTPLRANSSSPNGGCCSDAPIRSASPRRTGPRPGPPPPSTESNRPRGEPCASPAAPLTGNSTQPNAACPGVPSVRVEVPNVGIAMLRSSDPTRPLGG